MNGVLTEEELEGVLDDWCAGMRRDGWRIESRIGLMASAVKSTRVRAFFRGVAVWIVAGILAALTRRYGGDGEWLLSAAISLAGFWYMVDAVATGVDRRTVTVDGEGAIQTVRRRS